MADGRRIRRVALAAAIALNLHAVAAVAQGSRHEYRQLHLGMEVRIVLHGVDSAPAGRAAAAAFARIAALEDVFSDWRPGSEVRRLTERSREWVTVSAELFEVLARANRLSAATNGVFDPTIGPLSVLWRGARAEGALPDPRALERARALVGWHHVTLDSASSRVRLEIPGLRLDLGGIAKGWILQEAGRVIALHGVASSMIEAGGDIVVSGPPPGEPGWRISVRSGIGDAVVVLTDAAIATSGSSEQFVVIDGRRYSHLVDPRTGVGVGGHAQVTVISHDAADADGLATALALLDRETGDRVAGRYRVRAVYRSN